MSNDLILTDFYKTTIMKLRLALVVLLLLPLFVKAQQDDPVNTPGNKSNVIFYSKGRMYVKYKDGEPNRGSAESTTLYIDGSAKFATHSAIEQKGRTELTGDFINAKDPRVLDDAAPNLFVNNDLGADEFAAMVAFVGGQYLDDSDPSNPVNRSTRQWIYGVDSLKSWNADEQKIKRYIDFPTLSVEKSAPGAEDDWRKVSLVTVDTSAAVKVHFVNANVANKNRFGVRSSYTADNKIKAGFLLIKHLSEYLDNNPKNFGAYSQVDFNLYDYDPSQSIDDGKFQGSGYDSDRPLIDPATADKSLRATVNGQVWNRLVGFTPPFEELGADYMFYHVLTKPSGSSITSWEGPIVNPYHKMQAGLGYFMTMELAHNDHIDVIDKRWDFDGDFNATILNDDTYQLQEGIHHTKRARGGYVFNRLTFEDYASAIRGAAGNPLPGQIGGPQENFRRFSYDPTKEDGGSAAWVGKDGKNKDRVEVIQSEKFNIGAVTVKLVPGLNFVGNPFMAPISLNCLVGLPFPAEYAFDGADAVKEQYYPSNLVYDENDGTGAGGGEFVVKPFGNNVYASSKFMTGDLRTKYWLINQAYARYDDAKNIYLYKVSYDYIDRLSGGSTGLTTGGAGAGASDIYGIAPEKYLIAPMQMFALQASREVEIQFNPLMRTFGATRFTKSTSRADQAFDKYKQNWFVVEAQDELSNVADRTTVAFRSDAKLKGDNDPFDTLKGLNEELGDAFNNYEQEGLTDYNDYKVNLKTDTPKSLLYTKSSDDIAMLGNAVPKHTKELPLFFDKPDESKLMKLKFYGTENVEAVPGVWLVDRTLDKIVEVTPGFEYSFQSASGDTDNLAGGNRFILRFYPDDKDVINNENTPIVCYYNTSMLYIKGLIEDDINSDVTIYDMQGRLMARTKVNNAPSMEYLKPLSLGTYIVKITGKRNHTAKFVNLQTN